jgi:hypothetical protein
MIDTVTDDADLAHLDEQQLRALVLSMRTTIAQRDREIDFKQRLIDKITHEMAVLKRLKFAAQSERFAPEQRSLLGEKGFLRVHGQSSESRWAVSVRSEKPTTRSR